MGLEGGCSGGKMQAGGHPGLAARATGGWLDWEAEVFNLAVLLHAKATGGFRAAVLRGARGVEEADADGACGRGLPGRGMDNSL